MGMSWFAHAQNHVLSVIHGKLISKNGSPAADVRVELKASHKSVFSDNNGDFIFQNLASLTDSLIISSVQYERYAFAVDVC